MDKKAADKILSLYWFIIIVIVAVGIVAMVYAFYHHPYDVRKLEARILSNDVADCLSQQGKLNSLLFNNQGKFDENFDLMHNCHLIFSTEDFADWKNHVQYFIKIDIYNSKNLDSSVFEIQKGNKNLISSCNIQQNKKYKREAECLDRSLFALDNSGNLYLIKIKSVIKKSEKNVE